MSHRNTHRSARASGTHRLTCEPCRERKVKCNRAYPSCSRCTQLGYSCSYRERVSHRATQSAIISRLQERIRDAEAMLALQSSLSKQSAISTTDDFLGAQNASPPMVSIQPEPSKTLSASTDHFVKPPTSTCDDSLVGPDFDAPWLNEYGFGNVNLDNMSLLDMDSGVSLSPTQPANEWPMTIQGVSFPQIPDPPSTISDDDLARLHSEFFNHIHSVMPIISKKRFYKHLEQSRDDVAVKSVSYAIALLATTVPEVDEHLRKPCYILARHYVDECESRDALGSPQRIDYLQALLLLTRFEINNRSCGRAWLVLGRAVRLAKMMRLDRMDCTDDTPCHSSVGLPEIPLPATNDAVELEERRRCLWALYVLEGLASVYTASPGLLDDNSLAVRLPSPGDLDSNFKPSLMPTLAEIHSTGSVHQQLTPFCGLILVTSTLRAVLLHTAQVLVGTRDDGRHQSPGFWDRHYSLIKLLDAYDTLLNPIMCPRTLYSDSVVFNLFLVFYAVKLRLSEVALEECERQRLPAMATAESMNQLRANALKIASGVRSSWGHQRFACDNLSLSGAFVGWPLYMAIKALNRATPADQKRGRASTVLMLYESLDDVEPQDGTWHGMLSQLSLSRNMWKRLVAPPGNHD